MSSEITSPTRPCATDLAAATLAHLRDPVVRANLALRRSIVREVRAQLEGEGFEEYETPVLGERINEYSAGLIRAQSAAGDEWWLTQSPQLFKQMLIASGRTRYLQFAHCFRDEPREPGRYDRMREFIQIDIEMVTDDPAEIRRLVERVMVRVCRAAGRAISTPFPEMDAATAVAHYGTDTPDLRTDPDEWSFVWITDFPLAEPDGSGRPRLVRHPMARPEQPPRDADHACSLRTYSYDLVLNGYEIGSGDLRIHDAAEQLAVLRAMDLPAEQYQVLLDVLADGCPPHGGVGLGLDRLAMALAGSRDIAQASAFPHWFGRVLPEEAP
ncbi:amino acid--tRNA ligase-related protein [Streptomyces sp. NPDC000987]|uniref:amino acid--tRNA ligase-related protein n=1 Tax=Streptomyces sp. NPDC000987 TaxID=3154374 RepID=UPI003318FF34